MSHAEIADERDLVLGRGQQMRRVIWTQDFDRVRIERDDNRSAIRLFCVVSRRGNYGLMAQVDAVENADREEERAA